MKHCWLWLGPVHCVLCLLTCREAVRVAAMVPCSCVFAVTVLDDDWPGSVLLLAPRGQLHRP